MCNRPHILPTGQKIACRNCNQCIKTRANEWVARAMAEKETSKETFSFTLTYNDSTEENRDGAKFFRYSDIKNFLKRLRRAADYHFKTDSGIRFICAGEIGSKGSERCHWHIIVYSQVDVLELGKWLHFHSRKKPKTREDKITIDKNAKRMEWSLWPHGFMTVQEPDQGGIRYALIYALKDQFGLPKSKGTMRQSVSDNIAYGHFRMSKRPPIGGLWLDQKIERLRQSGSVLTSLNLNVPSYTGYWYPSGVLRQQLLRAMYVINEVQKETTGHNAPQWSSLLATIDPETKDYEVLTNGETQDEETEEEIFLRVRLRTKEYDQLKDYRERRQRCGGIAPCAACRNSLDERIFEQLRASISQQLRERGKSYDELDQHHRTTTLQCHQLCAFKELASTQKAFS